MGAWLQVGCGKHGAQTRRHQAVAVSKATISTKKVLMQSVRHYPFLNYTSVCHLLPSPENAGNVPIDYRS